ncbi:TetR/AcrR family transcriptional regulator [Bacteriovoracaceae bacterium]|nr:TetR/AcrR family transcriptional regulator [Bacteriovoracaceae bacterium]
MGQRQAKISQILQAATAEFLTRGLDAASMQNIADQAEVSKRTLYKYYSNKQELYIALTEMILIQIEDMYHFKNDSHLSLMEQIDKIIKNKIELTLTDSFLQISKIIIGEMFKGKMPIDEQMSRLNQSEVSFVTWIKEQQEKNLIINTIGADIIANQFHSILKGQIYWPVMMGLISKNEIDREQVKITVKDFFLKNFCILEKL